MTPRTPDVEISAEQPWPGLLPFTEVAKNFFHGRDEEAEELLRAIRRGTLSVLFGQSGLGKSSLLQAGLFPRLRTQDFFPVYIRLQLRDGAPALLQQLIEALSEACNAHGVEAPALDATRSLWEQFHRRDADFWSSRNRLLTPVLVFDQFEEIFTFAHGQKTADAGFDHFLSELADLVENRIPAALATAGGGEAALPESLDVARADFRVLFSFREDYLADFEGLRTRMPSIMRNRVRLARMSGTQAKAAILQSGGHLVPAPVADRIIRFVSAPHVNTRRVDIEAGLSEIEPALLSVVCRELNNRRLAVGQAEITAGLLEGSIQDQIIADFYESSFLGIDPRLREFVEDQLLTEAGFRDSFAYEDALRQPGVQREQVDRLVEHRLVRVEERAGVLRLELTHDLLTGVARDSRDRRQRARAERESRDREELRRRRLRRFVILSAATSCAAIAIIATFAILLRESNLERVRLAQTQAAVLLDRANGLFDQGTPAEPPWYLSRALALDRDNRSAIARALTYLEQRTFASLTATGLPQRAAGEQVFDVQWPAADHLLIRSSKGERSWPVPSNAALAVGDGVSAVHRTRVRELPSADADASWDGADASPSMVAAGALQVWLTQAHELRSALGRTSEFPAGTPVEGALAPLVVSQDGARVMLRAAHGQVVVYSLAAGRAPQRLHTISAGQGSLRFGLHGRRLAALDGVLASTYDLDTDQLHRMRHPLPVNALAIGPDDQVLATACQDQQARLWDLGSGEQISAPMVHGGAVLSVTFSADGRRLLSSALDGTARLWSVPGGKSLIEPLLAGGVASWARFSPDDSQAVVYDAEGRVTFWRLLDPAPTQFQTPWHAKIVASAFDARTGRLAVATDDDTLGVWLLPPATGTASPARRLWQRDRLQVRQLALSPGADVMAVADAQHRVQLVDASTGRDIAGPLQHYGDLRSMRFNEAGTRLVTGATDGAARIFDVATGRRLGFPIAPGSQSVIAAELSPDDQYLLTTTLDETRGGGQAIATVWLWSTQTRDVVSLGSSEHAALASFVGDRQILTVTGQSVQRWSIVPAAGLSVVRQGAPLTLGHLIWSAALSPKRDLVALGGLNGITRTVDLSTWRSVGDPMKSTGAIASVEYSSDGQWLLTRDSTDTVRIWNATSGVAVSDAITTDGVVAAAHLGNGGAQALLLEARGELVVHRLALDFPLPMPDWLPQLVTAAGGAALDDNGSITRAADREDQLSRLDKMDVGDPWWRQHRRDIMRHLNLSSGGNSP